ncbi:exopolysaccharide production repressor protein (plasmid) [Rhizobium sp. CB3171]|uniref:exopolysaccharide production repressor protein n=1 Tax=Rhizobium sp. CB3171 TaxID=3039157 RepID=UPI0024B1B298|nr:exopolysaccharide production repressor protein [Rhizobium sp. CB3171]WFU07099.1 exopolysaccharide production repressor protein [Rhizobium sp. CB3171]
MCISLLGTYLVSHSIRRAMATTLDIWLLFQVAYFASVLFLMWRASCASKRSRRVLRFDDREEMRYRPEHCEKKH